MNLMDEARRRILLKRINDAYLCAKRCEADPSFMDRFKTWCDRLPEMVASFDEFHTKIISGYLEKGDDEAFLLQDEVRQMFDDTYADILEVKCKVFPDPPQPVVVVSGGNNSSSGVPVTDTNSQPHVKLPVLSLQTFDGDHKNWLGFRDLFDRMIHNNKKLSNVEKFSYLLSTLQGPALNLIKVFPLSDTHYEEAYRALLSRYENKRHLAFTSWEAILNAKLAANTASSLRQLLDIFSENLAILKTLDLPVKNWDFILFHTLLSKLHSSTRKEFEMTVASQDIPSFEVLKDFVTTYCQAWERSSSVNDTSPTVATTSKSNVGKRPAAFKSEKNPTTTLVANTPNNVCLYCSKEHYTGHCPDFQALTVYQRFDTARAKQWCMNCLRVNHTSRTCKSKSNCRTCGRRHHMLLHLPPRTPVEPQGTNPSSPPQPSSQASIPTTENAVNVLANTVVNDKTVLLSTAQVEVLDRWGNYQRIRVLLDSGSQANFLTEACANRLGLKKSRSAVPILGLSNSEVPDLGKVHCTVRPCGEPDRDLTFEAIVIPKVCSNMPSSKVDNKNWHMFNTINLADPNYHTPGPIDMLIGAELWPSILRPGSIPATGSSPMALNTAYGWVLLGSVPCESGGKLSAFLAITESKNAGLNAAIQRLWEIENIPGEYNSSPEDELCENIFSNTHTRNEQGRYVVDLPMKGDPPPFVDMRNIALRRFHGLEKRLEQKPTLKESYKDFMQDYLDSGHMSEVPPEDTHRPDAYFIPHHCVINENSPTTRLRVVFDASAKDKEGKSLNEFQLIGPKLQTDITAIIIRFRVHKTVFTADIRQMYRNILVNPKDRHLQRVLFRFDPSQPVTEYELNTVTYGVSSSPFLALRVIQQLAKDESENFPLAADCIKRGDIYVDDVVTGHNDIQVAHDLQKQFMGIMGSAGLELRKWACNEPSLLDHLPSEHCLSKSQTCDLDQDYYVKVLGLKWDPEADRFVYDVHPLKRGCSKRNILSELARIFDPCGFLAPLSFYAKCLVQKLWLQGVDWDEEPSPDIVISWKQYIDELPDLAKLSIPRHVTNSEVNTYQLHGFGDASEAGYGAVAYLRYELPDGTFRTHLLCAKSRVAPVKRVTLPRLELCAAVLVADLLCFLLDSLAPVLSIDKVFTWTDSLIALAWIQSPPHRWKTFIANRVSRIQRKLPNATWNYVDTKTNPADCVSRGLLPKQLVEHPLWFTGPSWLSKSQDCWPSVQQIPSQTLLLSEQEQKKFALVSNTASDDRFTDLLFRFSSLKKIQRTIVYVQRFIKAARKLPCNRGAITSTEMQEALTVLVLRTQHQCFANEFACIAKAKPLSKPMRKLSPFVDNKAILRVGGRLGNAPLNYDVKHPMILPCNHRLTNLIIQDVHETNLHPGLQTVQFLLNQRFWVLSARRAIRRCLHSCIRCFRTNPIPVQPVMANLPSTRVSGTKAFKIVGCDYAGPFNVILGKRRRGVRAQKVYLCLFVCHATKALHLEIANDLSSNAFIAALRRFIGRRGRCSHLFSDCGTNFVGAYRQLASLMKEAAETEYIAFSTHPPSGPHFSGLAEAGVKSVKAHLQRVVGSQLLTYEEFQTLIVQIEALLNSRPLCAVSNDPNDLSVLTPGHFLTLEPLTALPEASESHLNLHNRWQLLQKLHRDFWHRWHHDYLNTLMQKSKWTRNEGTISINDIVLIKEDNVKPLHWRFGRIINVHPGSDGVVRVATVRTESGVFKRPAVKLCPLPVH